MPHTVPLAAATIATLSLLVVAGFPAAGPAHPPTSPVSPVGEHVRLTTDPSRTPGASPEETWLIPHLEHVLTPAEVPHPDASVDRYRLPVDGGVVQELFVRPAQRWSAGHRGVDLRSGTGDPVRAPAPGLVTFAGTVVDRGVITVLHPDGLRSSLEPVEVLVDVGTTVAAGEVVGTVAATGSHCGPQPCVHWGVRRGDHYLDPLGLLGSTGPVVLLPAR